MAESSPMTGGGMSMVRFSMHSPDLVVCAGSPDVPTPGKSFGDSPELPRKDSTKPCIELSFENGFDGSDAHKTPSVKFSTVCQTFDREMSPDSSLELRPLPRIIINGTSDDLEPMQSPRNIETYQQNHDNCEGQESYGNLQQDYESQKKEMMEMRRVIEHLKMENQLKSKECQQAWTSLKDLQSELMRKSMHVGSLAFAIEGQVKEKSRWFSSLRDMTRKLKLMKIEHMKLSEEALTYKTCLEDFNKFSHTIKSTLKEQLDLHEHLKIKYIKGDKECKELYNKVLELKGNIRVFCRCRPLNSEEVAGGASMAIGFESAKEGELTVMSNGAPKKTFKFDAAFGPQSPQVEVFEGTAPFATSVLDGYNVCIFAYGQTGTGKTFTMEGTVEDRGVNFRTLEQLFHIIGERQKIYRYDISVSVLEVYNEQIRDLLAPGSQTGAVTKRLEVRQVSEGNHPVPGLVEARVSNMSEVWEVLQIGSNARAVGSTNANEHSSRSHCLHCVMVKGENLLTRECTKSKLWLVDLAGSERVAKTEVQGERLREAQNINRSLSALGDVISALASKSPHIPFRNSKLTHLLQDSLGGDSKTLMFLQISPNECDLSETLCSLNFASRVRGIELGPARKQFDNNPELLKYKQMAEKLKKDMKFKDMQMKMMEDTVHGLDLKIKDKELKNKNLQDKVKELESQLLIERKLARQHVDTKIAEQHHMKQQQDEMNTPSVRPPLASRTPGIYKNSNEVAALMKEQINPSRLLTENSFRTPALCPSCNGPIKCTDAAEKENNPKMAEQLRAQKRTGRASICTAAPGLPVASAPRRNSLIPLPSIVSTPQLPPSCQVVDMKEEGEVMFPERSLCDSSPRGMKSVGKKRTSTARRSISKKIQTRSPLPPHLRRGLNVGMVRVSIGSRGRMVQRKTATKEGLQKKKERGWNAGTFGKTAI